jgi:hypothetical protein
MQLQIMKIGVEFASALYTMTGGLSAPYMTEQDFVLQEGRKKFYKHQRNVIFITLVFKPSVQPLNQV